MTNTQTPKALSTLTAEQLDAQTQNIQLAAYHKRVSTFAFWFVFFGIVLMLIGLHFTGYLDEFPEKKGDPDAMPPLAVFGIVTSAAFFPLWGYLLGNKIGSWLYKK